MALLCWLAEESKSVAFIYLFLLKNWQVLEINLMEKFVENEAEEDLVDLFD